MHFDIESTVGPGLALSTANYTVGAAFNNEQNELLSA